MYTPLMRHPGEATTMADGDLGRPSQRIRISICKPAKLRDGNGAEDADSTLQSFMTNNDPSMRAWSAHSHMPQLPPASWVLKLEFGG